MPFTFPPPEVGDIVYFQAAPAAAQEYVATVPAGEVWKVFSISANITTGGVAGSRRTQAAAKNNAGNYAWTTGQALPQAAGLTWDFSFALGLENAPAAVNNTLSWPIPDNWIEAGGSIEIGLLGGTDLQTINTVRLTYVRWRV